MSFAFLLMLAALSTEAIQKSIDAAAAHGGGRVVVPAGVHDVTSIRLRSHVELHLEKGAVLRGSARSEDYFDFPKDVCSITPENSAKIFVYAWDAEDISITGEGTIEGQGPLFFDRSRLHREGRFWEKPKVPRPRMIQFVRCKGIRLEGATFKDCPGWCMLIRLCEDVLVNKIVIDSEQRMINSDGIDLDGCRRVKVTNSRFRTGDDCLILRSMMEEGSKDPVITEDIEVSNCELNSACQAIRMGCPSDDLIRRVRFVNIRASGWNGINFDYPVRYLRPYDEGRMHLTDVVVDGFEGKFQNCAVRMVVGPGVKLREIGDVTLRNFRVESAKPLNFLGNFDTPLRNIVLENFIANVPGDNVYVARATEPLVLKGCSFNGKNIDGVFSTPRGERQPLVRPKSSSWESKKSDEPRFYLNEENRK